MSLTRALPTRLRGAPPHLVVLAVLVAAHGLHLGTKGLGIHFAFMTSAYDQALYEQGVWLLSRFDAPYVTLMGRNLFGDHSSFVLLPFVPLYWFVDWSGILYVGQAAAISLAAVPVYAAARVVGLDRWISVGFAATYLLHPAVGWTALENFHPDAFYAPFVALALWAALARRFGWYWVAVALTLSVKEDAAVVLVPLGLLLMWRGERLRGAITAVVAAATSALMLLVVMRSFTGVAFRNSWRIPFGGLRGFLSTLVSDPIEVWRHFTSWERIRYLLQMILPVGAGFLAAPSVALVALGVLFVNVLSTFSYQFDIRFHYSLVAVPPLVVGTAWAASRLVGRARRVVVTLTFASALVGAWALGPLPGSRIEAYPVFLDHPSVAAAREIIAIVPEQASVTAFHTLTPHLARRHEIYMFPNPFVRQLYGVDVFARGDRLPAADLVEWVVLPVRLEPEFVRIWKSESSAFREVARNEWWVAWRRG